MAHVGAHLEAVGYSYSNYYLPIGMRTRWRGLSGAFDDEEESDFVPIAASTALHERFYARF